MSAAAALRPIVVVVVVVVVVAVAAGGCRGGGRGAGGGGAAAEVRIRLAAEPPHLNPLLGFDHVTQGDVYEPLFAVADAPRHDPAGALVPVLAAAWTRSADDREWSITLRAGVRWHDGVPFTADDVVFTLGLLRQPALPSSDDFDDLVAVEAPDPATVRVRFGHERAGRDRALAFVPILPRHVFGAGGALATHAANRTPIGTGPYRFAAWTPGQEIRLERWTAYWGTAPAIARVVYRIVPDANLAVTQLYAGELDVLLQPPPAALAALARDGFATVPYRDAIYWSVRWNCRRGPTADARVRRALSLLLDRETLRREVFAGRLELASGPWAPGDPAYDASVAPWPFDPDAARQLLAEAGPAPIALRLLLPPGTSERIATIWQDDARRAGVTLTLDVDAARAGQLQIDDGLLYRWSTDREQDMYPVLHSQQEGNVGGCSDPEVDRLLVAARETVDPAHRAAVEHALHRRLHEVEFETILGVDHAVAVTQRRLRGVAPDALGAPVRKMSVGE